MRKLFYILIALASFATIWGVQINNRTEAEDSYEYAYQAELGRAGWIYHPHHLIYGALAKDFHGGIRSLGYSGRAHAPLRLLSTVCAALTVMLMCLTCRRRLGINPIGSLLAGASLLFCYGFWRYGNEVEIIAPASLTGILAFYMASRNRQTSTDAIIAGVLAAMAIVMHIMNIAVALVAIPVIYLMRRELKLLPMYFASTLALAGGAYIGIYYFEPDSLILHTSPNILRFSFSALPKAAIAIIHDIASSNFILGFEQIRDALPKLFPTRMLAEELMMGANMPRWMPIIGSITFLLTSFAALTSIIMARKTWKSADRHNTEKSDKECVNMRPTLFASLAWIMTYALLVLVIEPSNPELWIMILVPLCIVFAATSIAPLARANGLWPVLLLVAMLASHNYVAGLLPLRNPHGDYNRRKSAWILENSHKGDIILTAGNPVFMRYLRYYSREPIIYLYNLKDTQLEQPASTLASIASQRGIGGRVLITSDVFDQPKSLRARFPNKTDSIDIFAKKAAGYVRMVHSDQTGEVYQLISLPR